MKILMLCDFFDESLQYQENLLAKYYIKHGHEVVVVASTFQNVFDFYNDKYNSNLPPNISYYGSLKIIRCPYSINLLNRLRRFKGIYSIIEDEIPDLIFAHDIDLNLIDATKFLKKNKKCKLILDSHTDYMNSAKNWISLNILHKILRRSILKYAKPYISKIYPVVPTSAKFLNEVHGIRYEDMELLILGSDVDFVEDIKEANIREDIREKYEIKRTDIVIFTGGKLNSVKRTDLLIEALQKSKNFNWKLFIVGDTDKKDLVYKQKLNSIIGNDNRIHFIGWTSATDVYKYMLASDFAVFPQSQSVLWQQAISCGLPLIVGLIKGNDISYLNKYDCIIALKDFQINLENLQYNIDLFLENRTHLYDAQQRAEKTTHELLDYNKIIAQTLS